MNGFRHRPYLCLVSGYSPIITSSCRADVYTVNRFDSTSTKGFIYRTPYRVRLSLYRTDGNGIQFILLRMVPEHSLKLSCLTFEPSVSGHSVLTSKGERKHIADCAI